MAVKQKYASPEATIDAYVEATRKGDVDALREMFAENALMWGFYQGEYYLGTPQIFFDEVRDNPSPAQTGLEYSGEIVNAERFGSLAQVALKEKGYLGGDFTNLFQLALLDGSWLIVSKAYADE